MLQITAFTFMDHLVLKCATWGRLPDGSSGWHTVGSGSVTVPAGADLSEDADLLAFVAEAILDIAYGADPQRF